jgi:hypothetical protein
MRIRKIKMRIRKIKMRIKKISLCLSSYLPYPQLFLPYPHFFFLILNLNNPPTILICSTQLRLRIELEWLGAELEWLYDSMMHSMIQSFIQ